MRIWVIPDLHGCLRTLRGMVEEKINLTREDQLYLLGDYVDRGPDPKGVIDYIRHLIEEGYQIFPIRGNHEEYILLALEKESQRKRRFFFFREPNKYYEEWLKSGGRSTLKSFGIQKITEFPQDYIDWFRSLKHYYILEKFVLVHAGMNFKRRDPFEDVHAILWSQAFTPENEKIGNRTIIHGHIPVSFDFLKSVLANPERKVIPLDTGCYYPGRPGMGILTALELQTFELLTQPNIEKI